MTLKIALIGVGNMGKIHLRVLKDIPEVDLVGVVDLDIEVVRSAAQKELVLLHVPSLL
jgi:predicted dehydrogenase